MHLLKRKGACRIKVLLVNLLTKSCGPMAGGSGRTLANNSRTAAGRSGVAAPRPTRSRLLTKSPQRAPAATRRNQCRGSENSNVCRPFRISHQSKWRFWPRANNITKCEVIGAHAKCNFVPNETGFFIQCRRLLCIFEVKGLTKLSPGRSARREEAG